MREGVFSNFLSDSVLQWACLQGVALINASVLPPGIKLFSSMSSTFFL